MDYQHYFTTEFPQLLDKLEADTPAQWGMMQAQHMVEHLSLIFYISRKDRGIKCHTPEEYLERSRKYLYSDRPLKREFKAPDLPKSGPLPLKFANLAEAKQMLLAAIQAFYQHYQAHPEDRLMHPIFGKLTLKEWEHFHYKHIQHHFQQFGLIEEQSLSAL